MTAPEQVRRLVDQFAEHHDAYHAAGYNETQVRREFVDPLFEALGWDVFNRKGYAEAHKEVIHEDAIRVGGRTKAPDYCFRAGGGVRTFFVEAKKPAVDIREAVSPAFQLRRYAWSAKLPISVLTDFEEFSVYDCRIRPAKTDKASTGRVLYFKYTEYLDRWAELAGLLSPKAVRRGSIDKFLGGRRVPKGTAEVDAAFLAEIESWRDVLARNIALRNTGISQRDLNFAVQRTIDRVIFLRICEDRGIEPYGTLQALQNGTAVYARLGELFRRADDRYNSGLFYFTPERGRRDPADELTLGLAIDDRVLKGILRDLYYPDSPYEFSVLPAEILGQVYEQFLGKVIRLTKGHQAKVEEKPEVKKAGGVYYTPSYIVDYIVRHTVGKLVEGKTPQEIGGLTATWRPSKTARPLAVVDPACGSGSFLLGAYQFLLDWHREWYENNDPEKHARAKLPRLYRSAKGVWRLTTAEKKRILLAHVHGVDIDSQAVEVTKLSLLLKVLEGESGETITNQLRLFHERALPDLSGNIKCGNSLIGPDFYAGRQKQLFDDEETLRINAFDWKAEFPEIFRGKNPGFDAVIGNPPYGFHQIHASDTKSYFKNHYSASAGSYEHYFLFYERSLSLLAPKGLHGFIVPVTWLTIPSARSLRKYILDNYAIRRIAWLPELVFRHAQVNTLISITAREPASSVDVEIHSELGFTVPPKARRSFTQNRWVDEDYYVGIFEEGLDQSTLKKMRSSPCLLGDLARPCSGYNPYEVGKGEKPGGGAHTLDTVRQKPYHSAKKLSSHWKPEIVGRDLKRYSVVVSKKRWIKYGPWLAAPRDPDNFKGPRILVQEIVGGKERRIVAAYYEGELYYSRDVIPVKLMDTRVSGLFILGILNSWLLTWYHHKRNPKAQKALFPKVLVSDLRKLPVPILDLKKRRDRTRHDRMVTLVGTMLALHEELARAKEPHRRTVLERRIKATDGEIDRLVYELYGLSDKEIALVEEGTGD